MDTQKKIIAILSGSFAFVLVIIFLLLYMSQLRFNDIKEADTKQRKKVVTTSLDQASKPLKNSAILNNNAVLCRPTHTGNKRDRCRN